MKSKYLDENQAYKDLYRLREGWAEITLLSSLLLRSIISGS
jgi:hypothetical protein